MAATEDLTAELIKFNAFLASEEDQERQARAEKKALRLREEAAATLKQVTGNPKAGKDDKEAAEAAWKAAIATEERVKAGGPLVEPGSEPEKPAASSEDDGAEDGSESESGETDAVAEDDSKSDDTDIVVDGESPPDEAGVVADGESPPDEAQPDEAQPDEAQADAVAPDETPTDEVTADEPPAPAAEEVPADDAPPVDEPALLLPDDVDVETAAEATDDSTETPTEPTVVGDVEGDDVPPPDQTEHPEAGSDAPAAG